MKFNDFVKTFGIDQSNREDALTALVTVLFDCAKDETPGIEEYREGQHQIYILGYDMREKTYNSINDYLASKHRSYDNDLINRIESGKAMEIVSKASPEVIWKLIHLIMTDVVFCLSQAYPPSVNVDNLFYYQETSHINTIEDIEILSDVCDVYDYGHIAFVDLRNPGMRSCYFSHKIKSIRNSFNRAQKYMNKKYRGVQ